MKKCFYLLLALLAFTTTAWAQWQGTGTETDPYQISSMADWNTFADKVNSGTPYFGEFFIMTADIGTSDNPVKKAVGASDKSSPGCGFSYGEDSRNKYFRGTFDGNGHTLTVSYSNSYGNTNSCYAAPFKFVKDATIKNLHVAGKITTHAAYGAGIVAKAYGTVNVISCRCSVYLDLRDSNLRSEPNVFDAGILSRAIGDINIVNCLFDGTIKCQNEYVCNIGGISGKGGPESTVNIANCLFAPKKLEYDDDEDCGTMYYIHYGNYKSISVTNCYYTKKYGSKQGTNAKDWTNEQLLAALGSGWQEVDGKVVPNTSLSPCTFTGDGTQASPYQIATIDDWCGLALNISAFCQNYSGKHFQLTADITLTDTTSGTMLGVSENMSFRGTFDGGGHNLTVNYTDNRNEHYCGPFRYINGATIANLHVTGTIVKAQKKHAGGFVGKAYGQNQIRNCRSSVTIESNTDGDGSHGGFIGDLREGYTEFAFCLFDGKMQGPNGANSRTTKWGGFVGWVADDGEANFKHCLFAPTDIKIDNKSGSRTFARRDDGDDVTFNNCYYFEALGSSQGKHARSINDNANVTMTPYGNPNPFNVSGITPYSTGSYYFNSGLEYGGVYYAGNGDEVLLNLSQVGEAPTGTTANSFIATPGSLSSTHSPYTLTMPDANVEITLAPSDWNTHAGTVNDPYPIYNAQQWALMVSRVHSNSSEINGYYGKYFKLMADITLTEVHNSGNSAVMVGISTGDNTKFRGTFDGNGHTITLDIEDYSSDNYCAPFRYLKDGTIKNLHVRGIIKKTNEKNAGGLVGKAEGSNEIRNCRSSVTINFTKDGDVTSGGFVGELRDGNNNSTNFYNCLFDGELYGTNAYGWGGFVGWVADGCWARFNNCLFNPTDINCNTTNGDTPSKTFARVHSSGHIAVQDCYYKTLINVAQNATDATSFDNEQLRFNLGHGWEIVTETEIDGTDTTYVEKVVPIMSKYSLSGDGTAASPYLINSVDDWNGLASNVFLGETYSEQYLQLTNDITVNRMVGTGTTSITWDTYSFSGTFDGDGNTLTFDYSTNVGGEGLIAPFRFVDGATIQNLVVEGTIVAANKYAAGIIGRVDGNTFLTNCRSSITINSSVVGEGNHGGLVGLVRTGSVLTIDGCLFDGKLLGSGTTHCGGLVGEAFKDQSYSSTVNITNSLYAPAELAEDETWVGTDGSSTLARYTNDDQVDVTNSYYMQALGATEGQGKQARSISAGNYVTMENEGTATEYNVIGITSYGTGIGLTSTILSGEEEEEVVALYAGLGDNVSLNLGYELPESYIFNGYTANNGGSVSGSSNPYTLTMPDENVTVGANYTVEWPGNGSKETPYLIYTTEQLDLLSTRVNGENSATYNTKYYKLMASIAYDDAVANNFTAIGTTIQNQFDHNFNGHFDGQGHTISGINSVSQWVYYNGLFGALESDAEVKDVTLANSTIGDGERAGGIAGWNKGTITGCRVISDVIINGDSLISYVHGGIVGANEGTVSRCTFTGSLTRTFSNPDPESIMYVYSYGGIVGINNENATLSDNFVASAVIPTTMHGYGAIAGLQRGTLTHNYYAACTVASTADATDVGCSSVSGTTITHGDLTENDGAVPGNVRTIAAPTDWNSQSPDGWAFIASPLYDDVNPQASDTVEMIFNGTDYDLYRLNPGTARWENWKTDENNNNAAPGFYLENGRSYLYATQTEKTVKFKGNADAFNLSDTTEVELGQGFNLVGNPFPRAAWIDKPYYTLNSNGSIVLTDPESTSTPISPCYGVVVEAQSDDETVTFSTTAPSTSGAVPNNGSIQMTLAQAVSTRGSASMKTLDNAIVSFNEGSELGKFYFGTQNANIYIPQDGKDYAIACVGRDGACTISTNEVPVNFKAKEDGTYSLTVNPEGVEVGYLHLIDNMTGADVDLLANPSYSFNAKTTDYESRFRLVFAAADEADGEPSEAFAFISDGNLIVNGTGTLQVIDLLGRQLFTRDIHSAFHIPHSTFPTGVYVLRLINGNDVKTQKIVVR